MIRATGLFAAVAAIAAMLFSASPAEAHRWRHGFYQPGYAPFFYPRRVYYPRPLFYPRPVFYPRPIFVPPPPPPPVFVRPVAYMPPPPVAYSYGYGYQYRPVQRKKHRVVKRVSKKPACVCK